MSVLVSGKCQPLPDYLQLVLKVCMWGGRCQNAPSGYTRAGKLSAAELLARWNFDLFVLTNLGTFVVRLKNCIHPGVL